MTANTSRASTYDALLSTTLDKYRPTLTDNVFNGRPLHRWLNEKGRRRMLDGGATIVEPLIYGAGEAAFYGENDVLDITPQQGISSATFDWKDIYATIYISGQEFRKNSGEAQILNLLDAKTMQAEETLKDALAQAEYADAPADDNTILGLGALINDAAGDLAASNTGADAIGNIDTQGKNEFWQSVVLDGSDAASGEEVRKLIRSGRNAASDSGSDRCDAAFTDQTTFEAVEDSYVHQVRYEDVDSANAGFENVMVSKMPLFWDFECPDGTVFGINSKYLQIVGHEDAWMKQTPFSVNPVDSTHSSNGATGGVRDGRYSIITCMLALTTRNRRRHFRINGIDIEAANTP